jgi:hypothetical protein
MVKERKRVRIQNGKKEEKEKRGEGLGGKGGIVAGG